MKWKTAFRMTWLSMKLLFRDANTYVFLVAIYVAMLQWNKIPRSLQASTGLQLNVYGYAVSLFSTPGATLVLALGALTMYATLPLLRENTVSEVMRCSRTTWVLSRILYVIVLAILYPVAMLFCASFTTFGSWAISSSWGKLLNTYAHGLVIDGAAMSIEINTEITSLYQPWQAWLITWGLQSGACLTLGLLTLGLSLIAGRYMTMIVGSMLAVFDFLIAQKLPYFLYHVSPFTWTRFAMVGLGTNGFVPTVQGSLLRYGFICCGLILFVFICARNQKRMSKTFLSEQY